MKVFFACCLLFSASLVYGQTKSVENAVMELEKKRFDAQVSRNYEFLEKVLAEDLVYTHSNGHQDGKQSYIQSLREGKQSYEDVNVQEQKVRVYGNTAVVSGICQVRATNNGETINTRLRYTDVYVKKGRQWQMVAWQSLRLAN
ncbi:nuclear transport factor 2 family protein [Larkinella soli]|uniref:nuclear transport factor 2 family protein n=1 Tax=Larkinella soli TaxID=1770527 RepID=UPI000FFC42A5|nr:nuclear transport factor 2 family protein [Larkinella soli]